jgi:hypothetical protein
MKLTPMKRGRFLPVLYASGAVLICASLLAAAQPDGVFDAMQAELQRSMQLELGQLEKPYYLSYSVDDEHIWSASATLGGLIASHTSSYRSPFVRIRVGDYKFDQTNWTGAGAQGPRYDLRNFPLDEDNPLVLRQYFWLTTDSVYKGALQAIARKRAALRSVTVSEVLNDFSPAKPNVLIGDYTPIKFAADEWAQRTRRVSGVFDSFPGLRGSSVNYTAVDSLHRFVNSEGSKIREQQTMGEIEMRASAQAPDGMILRDSAIFYTRDISRMIPEADLTSAAKAIGEQATKLAAAPLGDNYTGPILFEGAASPQLFAQLLGRNLHISRKPVAAPGAPNPVSPTELEGRRGVRILPEMFDVVDDPTLPLFGHQAADDEGVESKPLSLVEKGVLKDFLRTRQPVRGYSDSNGRAGISGSFGAEVPSPTNLMIRSSETSSVADLRKKLIDLCEQRGLPYGIVVRKLDFPSTAPLDEARRILAANGGSGQPISIPLYVYRLYVDGHEELVRGERFRGINARSLKDILAAGDDTQTLNYLDNGAPFALLGFGSSSAQVTVTAPSVLIDDMELTKADDELPKLPIVPSPMAAAAQTASTGDTPSIAQAASASPATPRR